jgi:hypothetical protein
MHVGVRAACVFEPQISDYSELMCRRIVIDDAARVSVVKIGFGDEIEHEGAEIAARASE